ncbi:uncharacterized protein [Rutidosis leptorrhynchoides]|uniref:uncharacterized protein n=1 Tax=Rutidosis leptorrhynchoides TaxID=125765 RepID=UPI003A99D9CE
MALFTHQVQCSNFLSKLQSRKKDAEPERVLTVFPKVKTTYGTLWKHTSCLSLRVQIAHASKRNLLKISSSKSGIQDSEEIMYDSQEVQNMKIPVTLESNGTIAGSIAVQDLFKSWLTLLRMPSPHHVAEGTLEGPFLNQIAETENKIIQNSGRSEILKMGWSTFLSLHPTIKVTAMIFIPMYLAINLKYGAEVVNELTPLWLGGPLIVTLYITMIQVITSLYIFSFKQSVKVLKKSPMVYDYVARGKLNEVIRNRSWTPMVEFWNLGCTEMSKRIKKKLQIWLVDKYMDYVESIWPSYCKFIRFLKRANFI